MNLIDAQDIVEKVDVISEEPSNSRFWQKTLWSQIKEKDKNLEIESNISFADEGDGLIFVKSTGIVDIDMDLIHKFMQGQWYYRYNPLVVKYNEIEVKENDCIFEVESNIFGYNKVAFCCKRQLVEMNNKSYYFYLNISDDRSNAIPFRDSQYLYRCFIFEQLPSSIRVTLLCKIQPTPWCHPTNALMGSKRQTLISMRFFKMLLDIPLFLHDEIPSYIETERNGFEKLLTPVLFGKELFSNNNYKVYEIGRFQGDINVQCVGSFRKKTQLTMNIETMIRLVFQNRCEIIEKKDNYFLLKKGPSMYYDASPDTIIFSSFIYSDECSMFHYHSAPMERIYKTKSKMFFFNSAYVLMSKDVDDYCNIQFFFDVSEKTTELSMEVILTFLRNMENSITSYSYNQIDDLDEPKFSTLKFALERKRANEGTSFFINLQHSTLQQICFYLDNNDIRNLKRTNKQIKTIISYVYSENINSNTKSSHSFSSDDSTSSSSSKSTQILPSLNNLLSPSVNSNEINKNGLTPSVASSPNPLNPPNSKINCLLLPSISSLYSSDLENDNAISNPIRIFEGHSNVINSIDINPRSTQFISGSSDRKLKIWEISQQPTSNKVFIGPNSSIVTSKYHNNYICVGYKCGTIKYIELNDNQKSIIFDSITGKIEGFLPLLENSFVVWNDSVQIINYFNFKQTIMFNYVGHSRKVTIVKPFVPSIYISGSVDRTVHLWDIRTKPTTLAEIKPHKSAVLQLDVIDSHHFCSIGNEKVLTIWDDRNLKMPFSCIENKVDAVCCYDNKIVCGCENSVIKIYDSSSHQIIKSLGCPLPETNFSVITMRNKTIVGGSRNGCLYYVNGL